MSIGTRIRFIRKAQGMTQKALGIKAGFPVEHADVRMSQYESGSRSPKKDVLKKIASALNVSQNALLVPDIDTDTQLMHILFALEDGYGLQICKSGSYTYLLLSDLKKRKPEIQAALLAWCTHAQMLKEGKITRAEYDQWRYNFSAAPTRSEKRKKDAVSDVP